METGALWNSVFNRTEYLDKLWLNVGEFLPTVPDKSRTFGDFQNLEVCKSRIDQLTRDQERLRKSISKGINDYELVSCISRKIVSSRAFYKLYEMVYKSVWIYEPHLSCLFLCEAPGGFIDAITDMRRKRGMDTTWVTQSKCDESNIEFNENITEERIIKIGNNDVTNSYCLNRTILEVKSKFPQGLDLITADGGIDIDEYNLQEIILTKLIFSEILIALCTQKKGGSFIIKFYDMFSPSTVKLFLLLVSLYKYVKIIKPNTSRVCNSERYVICNIYQPPDGFSHLLEDLLRLHKKWDTRANSCSHLDFCPLWTPPQPLITRLKNFNEKILSKQINSINECLRIIYGNDEYTKCIYFRLFFNKPRIHELLYNKVFFNHKIKKCLEWLRYHDIQTSRFFQTNY